MQRGRLRLTLAWFIRSVRPLFMASPIGTRFKGGPYAPMMDTTPPLRTESIAQWSAVAAPACSLNGRTPDDALHRAAARLAADGIDRGVPAEPVRLLLEVPDRVAHVAEVERLALRELLRELEPVFVLVDDQHAARAHEPRRLRAANSPTGPAPKTTTESPRLICAISAPWYPVG